MAKWSEPMVDRPREELTQMLAHQLDMLQVLCQSFDTGRPHAAAEIAVNLRVLYSDDPKQPLKDPSLLRQLGWYEREIVDTVKTMTGGDPNVLTVPVAGLAFLVPRFDGNGGIVEDWEPNTWVQSQHQLLTTKFEDWWLGQILTTNAGEVFPRRRIIRQVANQDRGGHVAPGIAKAYFELTRNADYGHGMQYVEGSYSVTDEIPPEAFKAVSRQDAGTKLIRALVR